MNPDPAGMLSERPIEEERLGGASSASRRWELLALFASAILVVSANARCLSLPALDDCFYARKAVEMARSGNLFTVTWNGQPTFQNPPLQIWIQSRAVALLGENDLAARLPSAVMALLTGVLVYRIALLTVGAEAGATAVAFLFLSPYFLNHARRCMMEIPLTFWTAASVLVVLEGLRRERLFPWLAVPLGAAILTKSVLGLLPLFILGASAPFSPSLRQALKGRYLQAGILGGILLGASWPVEQFLSHGSVALHEHFVREIGARSTERLDLWRLLTDYPYFLAAYFEPALPFALAGAFWLFTRRKEAERGALLVAWLVVPVVLYSLSSARSSRYIFPIFPALALCAGALLARFFPGAGLLLRRGIAAVLILGGAAILWVKPTLLEWDSTAIFKHDTIIRERVREGEALTYLGTRYWGLANPILYYTGRALGPPQLSGRDATDIAILSGSLLVLADRDQLPRIPWSEVHYKFLVETDDWVLVRLKQWEAGNPGPN